MLNLSRLFFNSNSNAFDDVITPTEEQRKALVEAKNKIRDHLRQSIRQATVSVLELPKQVEPRFRTQGSWSYKTCIQGAHLPPQEMDWDFGVYLPVSVWDEEAPPHKMAKAYFDLVEASLQDLCQAEGWSLDRSNKRCARVKIDHWAHIDLPLYAAPEEKFHGVAERIVEQASVRKNYLRESASVNLEERAEFGEMPGDFWAEMDDIHLATRDGKWTKSDPEQVSRWFDDQVLMHGPQLRRVCRYLKAWRDHHWQHGGPSSVLLMIMAAKSFERMDRHDDLALENAAKTVAEQILGEVKEVGIDGGEEDFNRLSDQDRQDTAERASALRWAIHTARHYGAGLKRDAVAKMQQQFGDRIPIDVELVVVDAASEVRSTEAREVLPPIVGATHAG